MLQDFRYAFRTLTKNPGFALVAILTLALGIGANTAIFSVIDAVLLRPLPFPQSNRLVTVEAVDTRTGLRSFVTSYPDFADWRKQNEVFSHMAAYRDSQFSLSGVAEPQHLTGEMVTSDFFSALGVHPAIGRGLLPEDDQAGRHVALLGEELWQTVFGADRSVIGKTISLNGSSYTVVGVMGPNFNFPMETPPVGLWVNLPADWDMAPQRGARSLGVLARLKPGVTMTEAQAEMEQITGSLARQYPKTNTNAAGAHIESLLETFVGDTRPALLMLLGAVALVLLIACANVANLVLARSIDRRRDIAVRQAMGAGRRRIVRELITESIVLALLGGGLGLGLAEWGTQALVDFIPRNIPRISQIGINGGVFAFALAVSLATGILFGLVPAIGAARTNLVDALKEGGRTLGGSGHNRLRAAFVVSEMGLALTLLMGAGLVIRSFERLEHVNPGLDPHNLLTFRVDLPDARYSTEQRVNFFDQLRQNLEALPGVEAVAQTLPFPLSGNHLQVGFTIEGRPVAAGNEPVADFETISPGYFRALGIPVLEGRELAANDTRDALPVVVVNHAFAQKYFSNEDPVGRRIAPQISDHDVKEMPAREIIGVVGDVKTAAISQKSKPEFYLPASQCMIGSMTMAVRTAGNPTAFVDAIRATVKRMDPNLPVYRIKKMDEYLGTSVAQPRFSAFLLGLFAALAVVLTGLGLYGVISYTVAQRTREIGIRRALGAQTTDVLRVVIRQALMLTALGWVVGAIATIVLTRFISSQLYGIGANDPLTFFAVSALLAGVAILASYLPARRAASVDPMVALRYE
jgi:putative ABC transport system permease protein